MSNLINGFFKGEPEPQQPSPKQPPPEIRPPTNNASKWQRQFRANEILIDELEAKNLSMKNMYDELTLKINDL